MATIVGAKSVEGGEIMHGIHEGHQGISWVKLLADQVIRQVAVYIEKDHSNDLANPRLYERDSSKKQASDVNRVTRLSCGGIGFV